ncbi:hypothetical protein [Shewanella zhangzhouensis]|uniref:hypothetical protein n=1 Tax=Shewanella zhangzhouensis TaxID=2864213 RepID=UPI001C654C7B|nr:hypothetical protein [Shewanella zhangzhouensis]QYK04504.1 hypothetical protein K0H63_15775 [Shewanella zhangzhouensis]
MSRVIFAVFLFFVSLSTYAADCFKFKHEACIVSMVELIASPDRFDKRNVIVHGVLGYSNNSYKLYLSRDFFDIDSTVNSINIVVGDSRIENFDEHLSKYVQLKGVFSKTKYPYSAIPSEILLNDPIYYFEKVK